MVGSKGRLVELPITQPPALELTSCHIHQAALALCTPLYAYLQAASVMVSAYPYVPGLLSLLHGLRHVQGARSQP